MPKKITVCLSMIVKNESHIIKETLQNMLPYIDTWAICDTGSTDGTQDIIIEFFKEYNMSGELLQHEWKNFGHNRTLALEAAKDKATYSFVMDADDVFVGNFKLPNKMTADSYQVKIGKDFTYNRELIFKNSENWRYRGVLHEYVECYSKKNHSSVMITGNYYLDSRRMGARSQDPEKYNKDGKVLANAIEQGIDPDLKNRYAFYAGQSFFDYGDYKNAIKYYQIRADAGGWKDEVYYSFYRIGKAKQLLNYSIQEIKKSFMDAHNALPIRAEPLYELAIYYHEHGQYQEAYLYAEKASSLSFPGNQSLFVSSDIYEWKAKDQMAISAYYLGKYEESFNICQKLLQNSNLTEEEKLRIEENRDFSVPHLKDIYVKYPTVLVNKIAKHIRKTKKNRVTLSVTTCKRLDLFQKTINSFLQCCLDVMEIDRWICVDDNSSKKDREAMKKLYPFFEFVWKTPEQKGHPHSMNIIREKLNSPYLLHMEDDWHFFEKKNYIKPAIEILNGDRNLGQVCFNRNYAEILKDRSIPGGSVNYIGKFHYLVHEHYTMDSPEYMDFMHRNGYKPSNAYWPHYSLRPSMIRSSILASVGEYSTSAGHFEMEYAYRYKNLGYKTAFFNGICCLHIGRLTSERHDNSKRNAYELNGMNQFGEKKEIQKDMEFDEYLFYPNKDSMRGDIEYDERSTLQELKEKCDKNKKAIAFNTYGYIKDTVCPEPEFIDLKNIYRQKHHQNDGLYVHKKRYEKYQRKKTLLPIEHDEFLFYPNKDSFGNDIMYHFSDDLDQMFQKCIENENCVGFNTYGYFKFHISNPEFFIALNNNFSIPYSQPDGLYVHKKRFEKYQNLRTVKIVPTWCSSNDLIKNWRRMSLGNSEWHNFKLVSSDSKQGDYYVIINKPNKENDDYDPKRTIIFQMEPRREKENHGIKSWGKWANPDKTKFLQVRESHYFPNNLEWHLGRTIDMFKKDIVKKPDSTISAVVSTNNCDTGHNLRIDFLKYLEKKEIPVDIYGRCASLNFKNYHGELPVMEKDFGIIPYKYHFACENNAEKNYFTEKIVDAIMGESLCFYWGCPNIEDYLPPECMIRLSLDPDNFEKDYQLIKQSIENNEWKKRLPAIREAKYRIMNELQFFPTMDKIISIHQSSVPLINTYFDRIFVINLDKCKDRWAKIEDQFRNTGITNYERFSAINPEQARESGWPVPIAHMDRTQYNINFDAQLACKLSHYRVLEIAKSKNYSRVLILEDDIIATQDNIMKLNLALQEMIDKKIDWDLLYLYGSYGSIGEQIGHYIYQFNHLLSLASYAIDLKNYDVIRNEIEKAHDLLIDDIYANRIHTIKDLKCIAIHPYCIYPDIHNISTITGDRETNKLSDLKYVCINLERREDRKNKIIDLFKEKNMDIPEFFKAIDGKTLTATNEIKNIFKGNDFGNRRTFIGCALSHFNLWKKLLDDKKYTSYLVMEDDISLHQNYSNLFEKSFKILEENFQNWEMILYGYSNTDFKAEQPTKEQSINFKLFEANDYIGGFFGYLINKKGAKKLIDFIKENGIKHGIDYLIKKYHNELNMLVLKSDPLLIYSKCVTSVNDNVDSDIQKDFNALF